MTSTEILLAVDIGGTFTDIVVLDTATQKIVVEKVLTTYPADGLNGGKPGAVGEVILSDGTHPHPKNHYTLQPGQHVVLKLPGGGGFNAPTLRDPQHVLEDVRQGYVSLKRAAADYGVIIDPTTMMVDQAATQARRQEMEDDR